MANRRMLSKSISYSLQVSRLSTNAKLLFTWMIPHADDDGRLKGEPEYVKGMIVPLLNWSVEDVKGYLGEMSQQGLIYHWDEDGDWFIQFPKWSSHQQIRKDRYNESKYPTYPFNEEMTTNGQPNGNQGSTQYSSIQENINEGNKGERKKEEFEEETQTFEEGGE